MLTPFQVCFNFPTRQKRSCLKIKIFFSPAINPNFTTCCACHEKWHMNLTKSCACHETRTLTRQSVKGRTLLIMQLYPQLGMPKKRTPFRYQYCSDRWKYLALPATKSDTGILPNAAHDTQKMGYWLFKCCTSSDENNIKRLFDIYGIIKEAEIRKKSNKTTNSQNLRSVCFVIMLNLGVMRRWLRGAAAPH